MLLRILCSASVFFLKCGHEFWALLAFFSWLSHVSCFFFLDVMSRKRVSACVSCSSSGVKLRRTAEVRTCLAFSLHLARFACLSRLNDCFALVLQAPRVSFADLSLDDLHRLQYADEQQSFNHFPSRSEIAPELVQVSASSLRCWPCVRFIFFVHLRVAGDCLANLQRSC